MGRAAPGAAVSRRRLALGLPLRRLPGDVPGPLREADARIGHSGGRGVLDDLLSETLAWLVEAAHERGLQSSIVLLADESYDPVLLASRRLAAGRPLFRHDGFLVFLWDPRHGHG